MSHRKFLEEIDSKINRQGPADYPKAVFVLHDQQNMQAWPEWVGGNASPNGLPDER